MSTQAARTVSRGLRDLLSAAAPHWSARNMRAVVAKLLKLGISDCPHLACYLGSAAPSVGEKDKNRLNRELHAIGEKGFSKPTLAAMKR